MTLAPADLVRDSCAQLAGYRRTLEAVVAEPSSPGTAAGMAPRPADAPMPGNAQAFTALMVIWEAVPRLEASIRLAVAGHPGTRRGGGPRHFLAALESVVALSGGLDEDGEALAARVLERLADLARRVPDIDEAQRWRPVPQRACPYCGCFFLRVLLSTRRASRRAAWSASATPRRGRAGRRGRGCSTSRGTWRRTT